MSEDVWSEENTDPDAIADALLELLRARHAEDETLAPARVLNLVVVVDRSWKGEIANRLDRVGRYHASRTVLCAVEEGRRTLDAVAVMRYPDESDGDISVMHEMVEIDMGPDHLVGLETIVDPVVVSELPTMLWSPHGYQQAIDALLGIVDVMLIDSDEGEESPAAALDYASQLVSSAYVVDLAWLRTTPWRERLAASFDPPERRSALARLRGVKIRHRRTSAPSALLLAGWLASRLHWEIQPLGSANGDGLHGTAQREPGQEVELTLDPVEQDVPGLAGVTVTCGGPFSLSLDRSRGGLHAREESAEGEREWRVLGASRGEGGILGEGVRQALLRDPTYGPALGMARALTG